MPHRSLAVLEIARATGLDTGRGDEPISDDQFEEFNANYRRWAQERDLALKQHLRTNASAFRTLLSYNDRAFPIAYNLQWYFDEILIKDPVGVLVEQDAPERREELKYQLRDMLRFFEQFRPALDSGQVLLYGESAREPQADVPPDVLTDLAGRPALSQVLRSAAECGLEPRLDADGREWHVYRVDIDGVGMLGWHGKELSGQVTSPAIRIDERFRSATVEQIDELLGDESVVARLYTSKIERTLKFVDLANALGAAPLFDRNVDAVIVNEAGANVHQAEAIQALNLSLPYLLGANPDSLSKLREDDALAFVDFRSKMHELVRLGLQGGLTEHISAFADREIVPELRSIEKQMAALAARRNLAVFIASGVLGGVLIDPTIALSLGGPALAWATKKVFDDIGAKAEAQRNPFYWLWRARTGSK